VSAHLARCIVSWGCKGGIIGATRDPPSDARVHARLLRK
jgi:hypothetical protein